MTGSAHENTGETMRPEDVPDELVRAAVKARVVAIRALPGAFVEEVRQMLAAVLPLYEWQVRAELDRATALSAADHLAAEAAEDENDRLRAELAAARADVARVLAAYDAAAASDWEDETLDEIVRELKDRNDRG